MRGARHSAGLATAAALVLIACGGKPEGPPPGAKPGVVARVGDAEIGAAELREFVAQVPPTLRSSRSGDQARREYLRSLMARHVLAQECRRRGLDTAQVVVRRVEDRWRSRLVQSYRRDVLGRSVVVNDDDVRQLYEELELVRERHMAAIVVHSDTAAQRVVQQLREGADFGALARETSVDSRSAPAGGALGFINIHEARRLNIPDSVFYQLPAMVVGPVVPLAGSYQIIRFLEDREVPFGEVREDLRRELYQRRRDELEGRRVRDLEAELHWSVDPEGLRLLLDAAWGRRFLRRQDVSPATAEHALYRYDGGIASVGDLLDALWAASPMEAARGSGVADSGSVVAAAELLLLGPEMLTAAAYRAGIADRPEEQAWKHQVTEELAIQELRRREVLARSRVNDDEASEFYEDNEEVFRRPIEAFICEVLLTTEAEALEVKAATIAGRALADLARERSVRDGARENSGMMLVDAHVRLGHPLLYAAAREAPLERVTGPVAVEGGYSVFQVLNRTGGDVRPFDEVTLEARALARKQRRDDLLADLIDSLFAELGDRVVVYPEELAAALPESLLLSRNPQSADGAGSL